MFARSLLSFLVICLWFTACKRSEVDGIVIGDTLYTHQTYSENLELIQLIQKTLQGDEQALAKLHHVPCGGGAGGYDLGFIITQVIYRLGEKEFITMLEKLDDSKVSGWDGLIAAGLEYGDNDGDGRADEQGIEDVFPEILKFLEEKRSRRVLPPAR